MSSNAPAKTADAPEPAAERRSIPMWLVVLSGLLVYWASLFVSEDAGGFANDVYLPFHSSDEVTAANPIDPVQQEINKGRKVFEATCAACHQLNGLGKEGTAPPLDGSEWVQAAGGDRIAHVVMYGLTGPITVKGKEFNLSMVAWGETYTDDQLAAVLTFIRQQWSNKAGPIKPELLRAARAEKHKGPETAPELLRIPIQ
ncbi:MAG TPA: cytochrome c [Verrucomicrobiae bacterium]|jgi:mono/diheme cytochrome c family protein